MSLPEFPERRAVNSIESSGPEPNCPSGGPVSVSWASAGGRDAPRGPAGDRAGDIWPDGGTIRAEESADPGLFLPQVTPVRGSDALCVEPDVRPASGRFDRLGVSLPIDVGVRRGIRDMRVVLRAAAPSVRR